MNYPNLKKLGDFVHEVDERNTDLSVRRLVGVNLQKKFMPSVANIIGTDLSRYKIVRYNQFGLKLMSVERDRKMPISLMKSTEPGIISTAYFVFEVNDEKELLPDYLFLQIKQPEFDRRLWFSTGGDVRGGATWENLMDMPILVPPIAEQKRIVAQHQAIYSRITDCEHIIEGLDDCAQTIYRKTFIEDVDNESLPAGWKRGIIDDIAKISAGGDRPEVFSNIKTEACSIPIYSNGIVDDGLYGFTNEPRINEESVTVSARGTIGFVCYRNHPYVPIVRLLVFIPKDKSTVTPLYLFFLLSNTKLEGDGAVQLQLTAPKTKEIEIVIPTAGVIQDFTRRIEPLVYYKQCLKREIEALKNLINTILSVA